MRSLFFCLSILGLAAMLLAGCGGSGGGNTGGGGGGGNNGPTVVTVTFYPGTPSAVATKIGSGTLTTQTLTSNTLTLSIPQGTTSYELAFLCAETSGSGSSQTQTNQQFVIEATTQDETSQSVLCIAPNAFPGTGSPTQPQMGAFTFNIDASAVVGSGLSGQISLDTWNGTWSFFDPLQTGVDSTSGTVNMPTGNSIVDILVSGYDTSGNSSLLAARQYTSQAVPGSLNDGNPVVFGAADLLPQQPITYQNTPAGLDPSVYISYLSSGWGPAPNLVQNDTSFVTSYPTMPSSMAQSGDYYFFIISALQPGLSQQVGVDTINSGGPQTIQFPAVWNYSGPTAAPLPTFDFSGYTGFSGSSPITRYAEIGWTVSNGTIDVASVEATASASAGTTSLAMPDLSGLTGFLAAPASGSQLTWVAEIAERSMAFFAGTPKPGSDSWASTEGHYTVP